METSVTQSRNRSAAAYIKSSAMLCDQKFVQPKQLLTLVNWSLEKRT